MTLTLSTVPMAMQTNLAGGIVARITVKYHFGAGRVYAGAHVYLCLFVIYVTIRMAVISGVYATLQCQCNSTNT